MSALTQQEIAENLFGAIETIVAQQISNLNFDKTVLCTIVGVDAAETGIYDVTDGATIFQASSDRTNYKVNQQVYVLFSQDGSRVIVGRYITEQDEQIKYVPLSKRLYPSHESSIYQTDDERTLKANVDSDIVITLNEDEKIGSLQNLTGYNCLQIKADVKTTITDASRGNYGIGVEIEFENDKMTFLLDSEHDMFGNPYHYPSYFTQEQAYDLGQDISEFGEIKNITIKFYQQNNFDKTGDISFKNVQIAFVQEISQKADDSVEIYSSSSNIYESESDKKEITLQFFNKTEDNEYIGFSDGVLESMPDEESDTNEIYYAIKWYNKDGNGIATHLGDIDDQTIVEVSCLELSKETSFYAEVWRNGELLSTSNSITFKNVNSDYISDDTNSYKINSYIKTDQTAFTSLYDASGFAINNYEATKDRTLEFAYKWYDGISSDYEIEFKDYEWTIPNNSTMIASGKAEGKVLTYKLKEWYNPAWQNNTISCIATDKNGNKYQAIISLTFSSYGNQGTKYSIIISPVNGQPAYTEGDSAYELEAKLYDADGKIIADDNIEEWNNSFPAPASISENNYSIATSEVVIEGVNLQAKYPIAWRSNGNYNYEGPIYIVYNSNGTNPQYYPGELKLYGYEGAIKWSVINTNDNTDSDFTIKNKRLIPAIAYDLSKQYQYIILAEDSEDNILYKQPLIITQNTWASQLLNEWDGALKIDQKDNYILSAMLTAGSKDAQNQFTGVVMGQVGKLDDNALSAKHGLFGYQGGTQTFGFNIDGTAFLGGPSSGRIEFDGSVGEIKSATWDDTEGAEGMLISLTQSQIRSPGFRLNGAPGENENYFELGKNQELVYSNQNSLIFSAGLIQSSNWNGAYDFDQEEVNESGTDGTLLDLNNGYMEILNEIRVGKSDQHFIQLNGVEGFILKYNDQILESINQNDLMLKTINFNIEGSTSSTTVTRTYYDYVQRGMSRATPELRIRSGPGTSYGSLGWTKTVSYSTSKFWFFPPENSSGTSVKDTYGWYPIYIYKPSGKTEYVQCTVPEELPKTATPTIGYIYGYGVAGGTQLFPMDGGGTRGSVTYTTETETNTVEVTGGALNLNSTRGGYLILQQANDNTKSIIIGNNPNDSTYALQIGSFKIKWDGSQG